ncbi:GNAT family N-acetyltransferase [Micromonospora sp. CPCC 206060]|uniref:GNAT family N-acetyltransferase n=1 Tax=Micromonospora sp. CPCC 206060 TaxID=3122406 RepID=UPI002FF41BD3
MSPRIERVGPDEARPVAELIATAFAPLAAVAWLVPEEARRVAVLAGNFEILADHALRHGLVYATGDRAAMSVWLPQTGEPTPPPEDYDRRLEAACGEYTPRFRVLDGLFEASHPHDAHHHLAFLAVAPHRQGAGLGTALLDHHHRWLDAFGVPAYLEASNEQSRDLYARHGYVPREPFRLPDGTPFHPMWREPR